MGPRLDDLNFWFHLTDTRKMEITLDAFIADLIEIQKTSGLGSRELKFGTTKTSFSKRDGDRSVILNAHRLLSICHLFGQVPREECLDGDPWIILDHNVKGSFEVMMERPEHG